jgi:hypothetical protein
MTLKLPSGTRESALRLKWSQDPVLGNSQPSLRDYSTYGRVNPGLNVLGYSQSSLRDFSPASCQSDSLTQVFWFVYVRAEGLRKKSVGIG